MDIRFMNEAIALAKEAAALGEVPVGAVVVKKSTGEIVGRGCNRRVSDRSPLAHAELIAIDQASKRLGGWRLIDCELYVTLEPCPMCSGAIINSRVENVIFGAYDRRFGACGSVITLFDLPFNHKPELTGGVMEEECAALLSDFFKKLREKKTK
ncbi:MAG: tRNA adenosine(34) deaminase TadA [Ruminococcus sp.]|nr:tRNA adenosine(34) deaminase TadA [Ruminococcus sp.]